MYHSFGQSNNSGGRRLPAACPPPGHRPATERSPWTRVPFGSLALQPSPLIHIRKGQAPLLQLPLLTVSFAGFPDNTRRKNRAMPDG